MKAGYHQIFLKESDIKKTAFNTRYGQYQYKMLPFGLCNAPPAFIAAIVDIFVLVYLDDILIFNQAREQHLKDFKNAVEMH